MNFSIFINLLKIIPPLSLILLSSCSTHVYKIDSEPSGADIYRYQDGVYKYYAKTPFYEASMDSLKWSGNNFIAKYNGYYDSEPESPSRTGSGQMSLNFELRQNELFILERYLSENSLEQYWLFLQNHSDSNHVSRIYEPMLTLIAQKTDPANDYQRFLGYVRNTDIRNNVFARLIDLVANSHNPVAGYKKLLSDYTDSELRTNAFNRVVGLIKKNHAPLAGLYALLDQFPDLPKYQKGIFSDLVAYIEKTKKPVAAYKQLLSNDGYKSYLSSNNDARLSATIYKNLVKHIKRTLTPLTGLYTLLDEDPAAINYASTIFPAMIHYIEPMESGDKKLSLLLAKYPASSQYMPDRIRLAGIGPAGMRVFEIKALIEQGLGKSILTQKILNAGNPYKEFNFSEIASLGKMGIPDEVVAAMLNVTASYNKNMAENKRREEAEIRRKEMAKAEQRRRERAERERRQAAAEAERQRQEQAARAAAGQRDEKNTPVECLKLVAALKACDETSGFLSMGCKAIANNSFDCPIPVGQLM